MSLFVVVFCNKQMQLKPQFVLTWHVMIALWSDNGKDNACPRICHRWHPDYGTELLKLHSKWIPSFPVQSSFRIIECVALNILKFVSVTSGSDVNICFKIIASHTTKQTSDASSSVCGQIAPQAESPWAGVALAPGALGIQRPRTWLPGITRL